MTRMEPSIRVGSLEIRRHNGHVTVFQDSEREDKPADFIIVRTAGEADVLARILGRVFGVEWLQIDDALSQAAAQLGKRGGKKGGKARAASLTKAERSQIARAAARARWSKR